MTFLEIVFNVVVSVVQFLKRFFKFSEYYVQKVELLYTRDGDRRDSDVTVEYKHYGGAKGVLKDTSAEVTDVCFRISYLYKLKPYVYLTRNPDHVFPPKRAMGFKVPVKEAFTLDKDGAPFQNVTYTVKLHEGPNVDFHGEDNLLCDMGLGDFSKLRLVNVMGTVVEVEDRISLQSLWLRGRT
jgi:hypothetical protein